MISDLKLDRHLPPSFSAGLQWSPDGRLAVACTRTLGGVSAQTGVELVSPAVARPWQGGGTHMDSTSCISWLDALRPRAKRWRNCADDSDGAERVADAVVDVAVTGMAWSPARTGSGGACLLAVLTNALDVVILTPPGRGSEAARPWTAKYSLSEAVGERDGVPASADDFGTAVHDVTALKRLKLHAMAWSAACGLDDRHRSVSVLATGNEAGEVYLWRIRDDEPPVLMEWRKVCDGWITNLKFSPPVKAGLFLTASSCDGELVLVSVHTDASVRVGAVQAMVSAGEAPFSAIAWHPSASDVLLCVAARINEVVIASVQADSGTFTVSTRDTDLACPAVNVIFGSDSTTAVQITVVSTSGGVAAVDYGPAVREAGTAGRVAKLLEARARAYVASRDARDGVRHADMRLLGLSTMHRCAALMYSASAGQRMNYPIASELWSRILFVGLPHAAGVWDIAERMPRPVSTRGLLWAAKFDAMDAPSEDEYVTGAVEAVRAKLAGATPSHDLESMLFTCRASFWRRMLTPLCEWAFACSPTSARRARVDENCDLIRQQLAVAVLNRFVQFDGTLDAVSGTVAYQHARYVGLATTSHRDVVVKALTKLRKHGYDVEEELERARLAQHELMRDVGISGVISDGDSDDARADTRADARKEDSCVACGSAVEIRFGSATVGVCRTGHTWATCALTLLPLMGLHQRSCSVCARSIIQSTGAPGSFIHDLLSLCDCCVFCGGTLYVM